jgi:hypothetical protein
MSAAGLKKPAGSAGYEKEALYRENSISKNLHTVNSTIAKMRNNLHLDWQQWQRFAIFNARLALDSAPDDVRQLFLGKPSETSKDTVFLAELFTTLVVSAEDMATATGLAYHYADLWDEAVALWGGQP